MKVDYLHKYTPAEILLLRDGYDVKLSDLVKFTLIDLLYKKVIHYELIQHFEVKTKFFHSFSKGEHYQNYLSALYELGFLSMFKKHPMLLLTEYIKACFSNFQNEKRLKSQVIKMNLSDFFIQNFIDGIFNRYKRNEEANFLYSKIRDEIKQVENDITSNKITNEERLNLLMSLHGNILFIDKDKCPIVKDIENEIQRQLSKQSSSDFDFIDFDSSVFDVGFSFLDNTFSAFDFDGFGGGDFGGAGADGVWDLIDLDVS